MRRLLRAIERAAGAVTTRVRKGAGLGRRPETTRFLEVFDFLREILSFLFVFVVENGQGYHNNHFDPLKNQDGPIQVGLPPRRYHHVKRLPRRSGPVTHTLWFIGAVIML